MKKFCCCAIFLSAVFCVIMGSVPIQAQMLMSNGSYTGDGNTDRPITGLGGKPQVVIIKSTSATEAVIRTSTMTGGTGNQSKPMVTATALSAFTNGITLLGTISDPNDGFTVGTASEVNTSLITYQYVTFRDRDVAPAEMAVGTYTGDGNTTQNITTVGFQPAYVIVISEGANPVVHRSSAMAGSFQFDNTASSTNLITNFLVNGFQVGNDARVNTNAVTYHYIAWAATPGSIAVGQYTGNGAARDITDPGFLPKYVIIKAQLTPQQVAVHKSDGGSDAGAQDNTTLPFGTTANITTAFITPWPANGFRVATDNTVNKGTPNAGTYFWMAFKGAIDNSLPVELSSFTATPSDGVVKLRWVGDSERIPEPRLQCVP
ncbi:hypothetical protein HYR99_32495 [Candidatus Poribacteria bacterium]|nr:hypothetical protein [Candidatus Poribacteria bacterium]